MELHRYDIIEAELECESGSACQKKKRPYIIVSNEKGTANAPIITKIFQVNRKCIIGHSSIGKAASFEGEIFVG